MKRTTGVAAIAHALEERGASAVKPQWRRAGGPDIAVGWYGINLFLHVVEPGASLTQAQRDWNEEWHGQLHVVEDVAGAMALLDELERVSRMPGGPKHEEGGFEPPKPWSPES